MNGREQSKTRRTVLPKPAGGPFRKRLRNFLRAEKGAAALYFALSAPLWIGGLGLGVEVGTWHLYQQKQLSVADALANSLAGRVGVGTSKAELDKLAVEVLTRSRFDFANQTYDFDISPAPSETAFKDGTTVTVTVSRTVPRLLTAFFESGNLTISGRAVAQVKEATPGCVLALSRENNWALQVIGAFGLSSDIQVAGCEVLSNSTAFNSFSVAGGNRLTTDCARTAGYFNNRGTLTVVSCQGGPNVARQEAGFTLDPYLNVPEPEITGLDCTTTSDYTVNAANPMPAPYYMPDGTPYWYFCGGKFTIATSMTLDAGLYIMENNGFFINDGFTVTGTDVQFYFAGTGFPQFLATTGVLRLSAPTTGPRAGILLFGGRANAPDAAVQSGVGSRFEGAIYFPAARVRFQASGDLEGCTQIIGRDVTLVGVWKGAGPCTTSWTNPIVASRVVRLVE